MALLYWWWNLWLTGFVTLLNSFYGNTHFEFLRHGGFKNLKKKQNKTNADKNTLFQPLSHLTVTICTDWSWIRTASQKDALWPTVHKRAMKRGKSPLLHISVSIRPILMHFILWSNTGISWSLAVNSQPIFSFRFPLSL